MDCSPKRTANRLETASERPVCDAHDALEQIADRLEALEDLVAEKDKRITELESDLEAEKERAAELESELATLKESAR